MPVHPPDPATRLYAPPQQATTTPAPLQPPTTAPASVSSGQGAQPISQPQLRPEDLKDPGVLNTIIQQMQTQINALSGAQGKTQLPAGAELGGSTISGLGVPQTPTDAISLTHAETNYSAAALAPKLEAGGTNSLQSYRALNSKAQTENYSNFLEGVLNTAPTANTSTVSAGSPSGGSVAVTVTAGAHLYVSGKQVTYAQRTDTLALPASYSISAISRSGGVVTATVTSPLLSTANIAVAGVGDSSFDGTFVVSRSTGSTLSWAQPGLDATSTGGTVTTGGCYYYLAATGSQTLALYGPALADTQQNRTAANIDGTCLIACVVINGSGFVTNQSAAGATPPATTGNSRLLTRL